MTCLKPALNVIACGDADKMVSSVCNPESPSAFRKINRIPAEALFIRPCRIRTISTFPLHFCDKKNMAAGIHFPVAMLNPATILSIGEISGQLVKSTIKRCLRVSLIMEIQSPKFIKNRVQFLVSDSQVFQINRFRFHRTQKKFHIILFNFVNHLMLGLSLTSFYGFQLKPCYRANTCYYPLSSNSSMYSFRCKHP
jgi:hypothetical protein